MSSDLRRITAGITARFKRRAYGRTFNCPVCHLELAVVEAELDYVRQREGDR